jgi:hypothetical protein
MACDRNAHVGTGASARPAKRNEARACHRTCPESFFAMDFADFPG